MRKLMMMAAVLMAASQAYGKSECPECREPTREAAPVQSQPQPQKIHYLDGGHNAVVFIEILDGSTLALENTMKKIAQTMDILDREADKSASCAWSNRTVDVLNDWASRKLPVVAALGDLSVSEIIAWSRSQARTNFKRSILAGTVEKLRAPCTLPNVPNTPLIRRGGGKQLD